MMEHDTSYDRPNPKVDGPKFTKTWFLWMIECLARPFLYAFGVARALPGVIPRVRQISKAPQPSSRRSNDNAKLGELWRLKGKSTVVFVAIGVRTRVFNSKITEIGLTIWPLSNLTPAETRCWQIDHAANSASDAIRDAPSAFLHGIAETIQETQINRVLLSTFQNLARQYRHICVIGHEISHKLKVLKPFWEIPEHVVVLDIQSIWQSQQHNAAYFSFENYLRAGGLTNMVDTTANAGNYSEEIIRLLQSLGSKSQFAYELHTHTDHSY